MTPTTDLGGVLTALLDPRSVFDLYFCVQERGIRSWRIHKTQPSPWHLLYVPDSHPIHGIVDGQSIRIEPGQILWIQPFTLFQLWVDASARSINVGICRFDLDHDRPPRLDVPYLIGTRPENEAVFEEILTGRPDTSPFDRILQRAVLARLICRAFATTSDGQDRSDPGGLAPQVRLQLQAFMIKRIEQRLTVQDLATHVGMNAEYLSRRFRQSFGQAPKSYLMHLRIRRAATYLLVGNDSITATAERFGYESVFLFSRQFKEAMGMSPKEWRRRKGLH